MNTSMIVNFFRAAIPVISLDSPAPEEQSVLEKICSDVADHPKIKAPVMAWTLADGMRSVTYHAESGISYAEVKGSNNPNHDPILSALSFIEQHQQSGIFVLIDLHPYLGSDPHRLDLAIMRKLKSLCFSLKATKKRIILLGQGITLCSDLSGLIYEQKVELPTSTEIRESFNFCFDDLKNLKFTVALDDEAVDRLVRSAQGLTFEEYWNGLRLATIANNGRLDITASDRIYQLKVEKLLKLNLELSPPPPVEIGGLAPLKTWIAQRTKLFNAAMTRTEIPSPKGLLLVGLPGTGKSLVAKTIGSWWNVPILKLDIGSLMNSLVGESEANMRHLLSTAEAVAPCILLLDEIDKAFASAGSGSVSTDSGVMMRMFGTFLTWMADKVAPVFVVATANDISALPPELSRKGRFDEIFFVDLPNVAERAEILKLHLAKYSAQLQNPEIESLAIASPEFSGAELEAAVTEAAIKAFDSERYPEIMASDVREAIANTVPLAQSYFNKVQALREWAATSARRASEVEEVNRGSRRVSMINN
ncbi:hypothetical protein C7H19_24100 [Aphanothece hegewaldii CCALA 016]|uniref:Uncharacterized AAA domain-containing protein ycf46 n=1 Tax=Aphanothece hegewaldii CCALA 016 TaxID=2107694 RepID=A0A2T1LQT9_9CHRO|nr:AAA family ATPase [Aphanothece hegewaldii]PSF30012.1 hypothetical protein C7H19_24100 [Aphanothece hegewaldii CCALA 016]